MKLELPPPAAIEDIQSITAYPTPSFTALSHLKNPLQPLRSLRETDPFFVSHFYIILFTTPPSTRRAVPLVAEACGDTT